MCEKSGIFNSNSVTTYRTRTITKKSVPYQRTEPLCKNWGVPYHTNLPHRRLLPFLVQTADWTHIIQSAHIGVVRGRGEKGPPSPPIEISPIIKMWQKNLVSSVSVSCSIFAYNSTHQQRSQEGGGRGARAPIGLKSMQKSTFLAFEANFCSKNENSPPQRDVVAAEVEKNLLLFGPE